MEKPPLTERNPCAPVSVECGLLAGLHNPNHTRIFRGIPYAAPPVGNLRWRPPQPLQPWEGVRPATEFGPSSFQFAPPDTSIYFGGETNFSEDCLYLNIWTGPEESQNRPVLVWFHFGAFQFGSGANPMYDGAKMAANGVTVVTVNYRLGRFGFLAHPELSNESGYHGSGNYGIMDQIAALKWVQRNIHAFGGDAGNVTIGGSSAGGASVHILRSSPLAKNLFSKAICESGPGATPTLDGRGHVAAFTTLAAGEKAGVELLNFLGVPSIAELRNTPPMKIVAAHLPHTQGMWKSDLWPGSTSLSIFDTGNPIVDGYVLPESPLEALISGRAADVPTLVGNVGNEASGLPHLTSLVDYHKYVREHFGRYADEALALYSASTDQEVPAASKQLLADQVFVWPTWTSARLQAKRLKSSVWYYLLLRAPPIPLESKLIERLFADAFHCVGALYTFGTLNVWKWNWTESDRKLSKVMADAWVRFLWFGSPNGAQGGQARDDDWPALQPTHSLVKVWDEEPRVEALQPRRAELMLFWDKYYGVVEHF